MDGIPENMSLVQGYYIAGEPRTDTQLAMYNYIYGMLIGAHVLSLYPIN